MYYRGRYYVTTLGRWLSNDPIGFNAGDVNLRRYVGNSPINATDPSGLQERQERLDMSDLDETLSGIADSEEAKEEAERIAAAIRNTWDQNSKTNMTGWLAWIWGGSDERAKGYYCYEWSNAFADAFEHESSGEFFTVEVETFGNHTAGAKATRVHSFIKVTSLETGESIYVDDGFMGDENGRSLGMVHRARPVRGIYEHHINNEPRKGLDIPPVVDHRGRKHGDRRRPGSGYSQPSRGWGGSEYVPYDDHSARYVGGAF